MVEAAKKEPTSTARINRLSGKDLPPVGAFKPLR